MEVDVLFGVSYFLPLDTDEQELKNYIPAFMDLSITEDLYRYI